MAKLLYLLEEGLAPEHSNTPLGIHVAKLQMRGLDIVEVFLPNLPFLHFYLPSPYLPLTNQKALAPKTTPSHCRGARADPPFLWLWRSDRSSLEETRADVNRDFLASRILGPSSEASGVFFIAASPTDSEPGMIGDLDVCVTLGFQGADCYVFVHQHSSSAPEGKNENSEDDHQHHVGTVKRTVGSVAHHFLFLSLLPTARAGSFQRCLYYNISFKLLQYIHAVYPTIITTFLPLLTSPPFQS